MPNAYAYLRVSTENQVGPGHHSTDAGWDAIQRYADANGIAIDESHRYIDEAVSGSVPMVDRPAGKELAAQLQSGDTLLVANADRLGRDMLDTLVFILELNKRGVKIIALDFFGQGVIDLSSTLGKFVLAAYLAAAENQRQEASRRTKATKDYLRSIGQSTNGRAVPLKARVPRRDENGNIVRNRWGRPVIDDVYDPKWIAVGMEIVRRHDAGETFRAIGRDFNRRGQRTPAGHRFALFYGNTCAGSKVDTLIRWYNATKDYMAEQERMANEATAGRT